MLSLLYGESLSKTAGLALNKGCAYLEKNLKEANEAAEAEEAAIPF